MKVKFYSVTAAFPVMPDPFTSILPSQVTIMAEESRPERRYYTQVNGDLLTMLVLTVNDRQRFAVATTNNDAVTIRSLDDHERLAEVNYLILNTATRAGVYAHYRGSCPPSQIQMVWRAQFRAYRLSFLPDDPQRPPLKGNLPALGLNMTADDFDSILASSKEIRGFRYHVVVDDIDDQIGVPIGKIKSYVREFKFGGGSEAKGLILKHLRKFMKDKAPIAPVVDILDDEGVAMRIGLETKLRAFESMPLDEFAVSDSLDLEDLRNSNEYRTVLSYLES